MSERVVCSKCRRYFKDTEELVFDYYDYEDYREDDEPKCHCIICGEEFSDGDTIHVISHRDISELSFIDEDDKMIDFLTHDKETFLDIYEECVSESEYEATKKDSIYRSGYWNAETLIEYDYVDGVSWKQIVSAQMLTEWLQKKV